MSTKKLRWGLLGTGAIARKFAAGLTESRNGVLAAIGSRTQESADRFAEDFPAHAHGTYEALLSDPEVDVIYISTPHPMHAEWAIKCAQTGKHVLCEKPLTMNHGEAVAVVDAARAHDVFLMEAFMYRCHPQTARVVDLIRSGAIGDVHLVQATFGFRAPLNLSSRLLDPALGGGGILDVGCYCASMARLIAGAVDGKLFADPLTVTGAGKIGEQTRVDEYAVATLAFANGMLAQLATAVRLQLDNQVRIWGTEGHIVIPTPWIISREAGASKIRLCKTGAPEEEIVTDSDLGIYACEADMVAEHIAKRQARAMSWDDSLGNMRTLDRWREAIGLVYDSEKAV